MNGDFIHRDPEEMLRYAKDLEKYVSSTTTIITGVHSLAKGYADELDDTCQLCVEKIEKTKDQLIKNLEAYTSLRKTMEERANKLKTAQSKGAKLFR